MKQNIYFTVESNLWILMFNEFQSVPGHFREQIQEQSFFNDLKAFQSKKCSTENNL